MTDAAMIDHVIVAHSKWKSLLREAIAKGSSELTIERARDCHLCDFGHWLEELSVAEKQTPRIQTLQTLHTRFHQEAARVLELATRHEKHEAETAMASGSPFVRASTDLVMALSEWKLQVQQHP